MVPTLLVTWLDHYTVGIQPEPHARTCFSFSDLNGEEHMLLLFKELHKLPKNILFLSRSRLDIPGSRWIPTSLIAAQNGDKGSFAIFPQGADAIYTFMGLQPVYYALVFPERTIEAGKPWTIRDKKSNRPYRVLELPGSNEMSYQCSFVLTTAAIPRWSAGRYVAAFGNNGPAEPRVDGSFTVS
jgi:hypothetical protein